MDYADMLYFLSAILSPAAFQPVIVDETWSVFQAQPSGNCVMSARDQSGTEILFVRYPDKSTSVIFSNKNWSSLSQKDERNLRVGLNTWPYSYHRVSVRDGYVVAKFNPGKLHDIFLNKQVIALDYKGKTLAFHYTGTTEMAALKQVDLCAGYVDDPFSS